MYYYFDPLYLYLVLPTFLFAVFAQIRVSSVFKKYSKQYTTSGMTGAEAAMAVLNQAGINGIFIQRTSGSLTDHFDPKNNTIFLSDNVHDSATVAAIGVAAHEAGHAIQYAENYFPIKIRTAIIPVTKIGSYLAVPIIILGFFLEMAGLVNFGILLFGSIVLFQLVTLPVEFDASKRAILALTNSNRVHPDEIPGAKKVLSAAALTYVAALAASIAQLLRFIVLANRRRR